ncbi:hypothetical protein OHA10_26160 [Kribbella sp. NBC_00662]|uniref:hypothetical protein n=1 Tax=Kribbella sp. NBC_00662 TaxID=2975969 RepID=UPI00324AB41B
MINSVSGEPDPPETTLMDAPRYRPVQVVNMPVRPAGRASSSRPAICSAGSASYPHSGSRTVMMTYSPTPSGSIPLRAGRPSM